MTHNEIHILYVQTILPNTWVKLGQMLKSRGLSSGEVLMALVQIADKKKEKILCG